MKYFLIFLFSLNAHADCQGLKIQNLDDVDFRNNSSPTESFRVQRTHGLNGCLFFVTIDNGGASSFSTRQLLHKNASDFIPVQICLDSNCSAIIKHFPEATSNSDVLFGSFPDNIPTPGGIDLTIYPRAAKVTYEKHGDYESSYTVRLYQGSITKSPELMDTETFRLKHRLEKKIDLSIVNTGSPFDPSSTSKTIHFGTLSTGQQTTFDLLLKYNAGYRVRISSQNNGKLSHSSLPSYVPYTLTLNGSEIYLGGSANNPVLISQGSGVSPPAGLRLAGGFRIGKVEEAKAGNYQDVLTVTVSTLE